MIRLLKVHSNSLLNRKVWKHLDSNPSAYMHSNHLGTRNWRYSAIQSKLYHMWNTRLNLKTSQITCPEIRQSVNVQINVLWIRKMPRAILTSFWITWAEIAKSGTVQLCKSDSSFILRNFKLVSPAIITEMKIWDASDHLRHERLIIGKLTLVSSWEISN